MLHDLWPSHGIIVSPRAPVSSLAELSPDAQAALGTALVAATRAIEAVVRPQRVYCALFAEEMRSVHFHLFPRSDWLLSSYSRVHPEDTEISGPRLMDWARRTFQKPITGMDSDATFEKIRTRLTSSTIAG